MSGTTMTRAQFEALPLSDRGAALRNARLVDDAPEPRRVVGPGEISRAAFDRLAPAQRAAAVKAGQRIVDAADGPATIARGAPPPGFAWASDGIGLVKVSADDDD
jgi:hypothetical protein